MVYDNVCKYLAEEYPSDFVRWLLNIESVDVEVLKTELKTEPLRADSLILLQVGNKILHSEFQTLPDYNNPIPFDKVESRNQQRELTACTDILAGLQFDRNFIRQILREELMRESVTYQDILQKGQKQGERIGLQLGLQQGKLELVIRQLTRRFGRIPSEQEDKINELSTVQIEDLAEALLDFQSMSDLVSWLENNS